MHDCGRFLGSKRPPNLTIRASLPRLLLLLVQELDLSFKGATFVLVLELLLEGADSEALKPLGLTPEAIAAKVESLRITFSQWHVEMKPERQAAILQEAFGGAV